MTFSRRVSSHRVQQSTTKKSIAFRTVSTRSDAITLNMGGSQSVTCSLLKIVNTQNRCCISWKNLTSTTANLFTTWRRIPMAWGQITISYWNLPVGSTPSTSTCRRTRVRRTSFKATTSGDWSTSTCRTWGAGWAINLCQHIWQLSASEEPKGNSNRQTLITISSNRSLKLAGA